jgi:hypothetical protein
MAKVTLWRDHIAYAALERCGIGKPAICLALPHGHAIDGDYEYAAGARQQRDFVEVLLKARQQFLGQPAGPEQPAALGSVMNGDSLFGQYRGTHVRTIAILALDRYHEENKQALDVWQASCARRTWIVQDRD